MRRWRRQGMDRLYVNDTTGTRLGWYDLQSGARMVEVAERAVEVAAAIDSWLVGDSRAPRESVLHPQVGAQSAPCPSLSPVTDIVPAPPSSVAVSTPTTNADPADLAANRAGAAAREQAILRRQQAPIRTTLARLLGVHTEERAWRIGAEGEEKVAAQLAKLGPRWHILHAVPVGEHGADIDHVVIGPGGIFTLNTKHHPGAKIWVAENTFMINGSRHPYIHKSRHEAQRAASLLSRAAGRRVPVTALLVPVGADEVTIKRAPEDVVVVSRMKVRKWLASRPEVLSDADVSSVYAVARRADVWRAAEA